MQTCGKNYRMHFQKNKVAGAKNCLPQLKSAKESNIKLTPNQEQILEQTKMSKRELESCNMHLFQLQFASFLFLYMACSVWSLFLLGDLALSIPFLPFCHFSIIFFFSLPDPHWQYSCLLICIWQLRPAVVVCSAEMKLSDLPALIARCTSGNYSN